MSMWREERLGKMRGGRKGEDGKVGEREKKENDDRRGDGVRPTGRERDRGREGQSATNLHNERATNERRSGFGGVDGNGCRLCGR